MKFHIGILVETSLMDLIKSNTENKARNQVPVTLSHSVPSHAPAVPEPVPSHPLEPQQQVQVQLEHVKEQVVMVMILTLLFWVEHRALVHPRVSEFHRTKMTEQRPKTTESESSPAAPSRALAEPEPVPEIPKDVAEEKSVIPVPSSDYKPDECPRLLSC
ncbi:Remorin protein [Spatholobus suberectus]|nr:Remorin protein [Spatholobus suberectus]